MVCRIDAAGTLAMVKWAETFEFVVKKRISPQMNIVWT